MTERRFRAVGTIVGANYGRLCREGGLTADAAIRALDDISAQRAAEARGAETAITTYIPQSKAQLESYGIEDVDVVERRWTTTRRRAASSQARPTG